MLFLCAPIVIVVVVSFNATEFIQFPPRAWSLRWYQNYFGSRQWVEPTLLSLRVAVVTMVLATVLGTTAAIGLMRGRFRWRRAIEFFFVSPMVVPTIVLAIGLYLLFARFKLVGQPLALYLAHTIVATPLVIVIVSAALRTTDPAIELAARSLGRRVLPRALARHAARHHARGDLGRGLRLPRLVRRGGAGDLPRRARDHDASPSGCGRASATRSIRR